MNIRRKHDDISVLGINDLDVKRCGNAFGVRFLTESLVQFGAHRGLQGSHIGGHIVYFYNV